MIAGLAQRLAVGLLLWLAAAASVRAAERIIQFISDVEVQSSGDLIVTETIEVEAEGQIIRRGIFRDFPTIYNRPNGTRVVVGFRLESVTRLVQRPGEVERWPLNENYTLETITNGIRIRIGHADRLLPSGRHTYIIRYRTTRQIGFFADHDELYWNATGTGWMFPIEMAEARVTLPEKVPFQQSAIYTGPLGGQGKEAVIVEQEPGRIVFRTTRALPPQNGLTVAVAWRKGVVAPPQRTRQILDWLQDNNGFAVIGLGLIAAYYTFAWLLVGRDPPKGVAIPLFAPPNDMSPAAVRFVDRMEFDDRCFVAAIVNLGVKGHLQIEEDARTTLKQRPGGRPLSSEEQKLKAMLFSGSNSLVLAPESRDRLSAASGALGQSLSDSYRTKMLVDNYRWSYFGLVLGLLVAVAALLALGIGALHRDFHLFMIAILIMTLPLVSCGAAWAFVGDRGGWLAQWFSSRGNLIVTAVAAAAAPLGAAWYMQPDIASLIMPGSLVMVAALVGVGFPLLKAPTRTARKIMDQIEGFREYLSVAEEDRLNALNPPAKTPELFERFLPYAIALDCQIAWAAKFTEVLTEAGTLPEATTWYTGRRDWITDPVAFADRLGGRIATTIVLSSIPPGSSSGVGSDSAVIGSSGGGGGGGGGGGW